MTIPLLYQGSVKDVRGPLKSGENDAVVFDYSDAYSVFDWGRMPDTLPSKGEALALIAADWFEKIENPETWKEFSKSPSALSLRKGNRFGAAFNELGEIIQAEGIRTHYLGVVTSNAISGTQVSVQSLKDVGTPFNQIAVKPVSVVHPRVSQVLGRGVSDYTATRSAPAPRLIPLEVVFRFSCPPGSSLIDRVAKDPAYLTSIGYHGLRVAAGEKWDFPVMELFTKLESSDRLLTLSEGLAISGVSSEVLQEVLFKTAWIAGWLRSICSGKGLDLADGKLEWAIDASGKLILVDAIGPDELRILAPGGAQLSKEFLRAFYRSTPWFSRMTKAKHDAAVKGTTEWKKGVTEGPEALTPKFRELGSHLYQALANEFTGRMFFPKAQSLAHVIEGLKEIQPR